MCQDKSGSQKNVHVELEFEFPTWVFAFAIIIYRFVGGFYISACA